MNTMMIFAIIVMILGVYLVIAAIRMKKSGRIGAGIITKDEINHCKDPKGFIRFMYRKEILFGIITILVGASVFFHQKSSLLEMIVFLVAFVWFQYSLRTARDAFV